MHVRRNASLLVVVAAALLGSCVGRPILTADPRVPRVSTVETRDTAIAAVTTAFRDSRPAPCRFGRKYDAIDCAKITAYLRTLALETFFAALWAWDNPPSPGFRSWACVADAETVPPHYGVHGSKYSSAFGMLNQAVRDRADSPASASRILAGTATPGEERRAAWRELLVFGPGAWGQLTQAKCRV